MQYYEAEHNKWDNENCKWIRTRKIFKTNKSRLTTADVVKALGIKDFDPVNDCVYWYPLNAMHNIATL